MKTRAVRLRGAYKLSLDEFELPEMGEDEILAELVTDSLCMSSYKAAVAGTAHKRVPADVAENPTIIGHECSGQILAVGGKWADKFSAGQCFTIQPALNLPDSYMTPGYSYRWFGGDATYVILPNEVMELGCLIPYNGDAFFDASLAEPYSCVIGAFHACYHVKKGSYVHEMGIKKGGTLALLAAAGPMGLAAADYAIHMEDGPSKIIVTDIDEARLARARVILPAEEAAKEGVELSYINTKDIPDTASYLRSLTNGHGFDDVFCFAPIEDVVILGEKLLAEGGCLNFFAGPTDKEFSAKFNFYRVHYEGTHIVGTSGGNVEDMREAINMASRGRLHPAILVTHIGGLDCVAEATLNLPKIGGGKKLIYTGIDLPLTALDSLPQLAEKEPRFARLACIVAENRGLWSPEAERELLSLYKKE